MHKELIERLRVGARGWLMQYHLNDAADAIEALQATATEYQQAADKMAMEHNIERDTLRQQLAEAQQKTAMLESVLSAVKHDESVALNACNALSQQLAEAQRDAERNHGLIELLKKHTEQLIEIAQELKNPRMPLATAVNATVPMLVEMARENLASIAAMKGTSA